MNISPRIRNGLDALLFRIDVFPGLYYQPLPWVGLEKARRGEGTLARWHAIQALLEGRTITSGMDIGCQVGYFPISLARQGIPMVGIDCDHRALRIAAYASRKLRLGMVGWWQMALSPETVRLLPQVDLTLLMSIWHHWVRDYGLELAGQMLSIVWAHCDSVLVFESGEAEMPASWGLPAMEPSPRRWLEDYLAITCEGGTVQHLGVFKAFAPQGNENRRIVHRNLFAVARTSSSS